MRWLPPVEPLGIVTDYLVRIRLASGDAVDCQAETILVSGSVECVLLVAAADLSVDEEGFLSATVPNRKFWL